MNLPRGDRLLRIGVGLVAHFENLRCYVFHVLLVILPDVSRERFSPSRGGENLHTVTSDSMRSRSLDALGCTELVVDDCVLLWFPRLEGIGFDVSDPALDTSDALLTVALVFRIEALTGV